MVYLIYFKKYIHISSLSVNTFICNNIKWKCVR